MNKMQKLNAFGQVQAQPQVVNVTYGHHGSGKLYSYYGQNKRTGDIVTPEVTHPKSGKSYKTLAVVRSTHNVKNAPSTFNYLHSKNTPIKPIGKTDQRSLPGYYKGWAKDAKAAQELRHETILRDDITPMQKKSLFGQIRKIRR